MERVQLEIVPSQPFRDAIHTARHPGSEYLWIDRLCVMQDSPEDWDTESRTMGDIYRDATCNIAASDAKIGFEGCSYPRNPRTLEHERLSLPQPRTYISSTQDE